MYDWDEAKREWTLETRGLDFADMARFDWDSALVAPDTRTEYGEPRFVAIGPLDDDICVVCYTTRGESIRIISLRKASRKERNLYHGT